MFAPHDRENSELGKVWFAPEDFLDLLKLFLGQAMLPDKFGCDDRISRRRLFGHPYVTLTNPRSGSITQSRCTYESV